MAGTVCQIQGKIYGMVWFIGIAKEFWWRGQFVKYRVRWDSLSNTGKDGHSRYVTIWFFGLFCVPIVDKKPIIKWWLISCM